MEAPRESLCSGRAPACPGDIPRCCPSSVPCSKVCSRARGCPAVGWALCNPQVSLGSSPCPGDSRQTCWELAAPGAWQNHGWCCQGPLHLCVCSNSNKDWGFFPQAAPGKYFTTWLVALAPRRTPDASPCQVWARCRQIQALLFPSLLCWQVLGRFLGRAAPCGTRDIPGTHTQVLRGCSAPAAVALVLRWCPNPGEPQGCQALPSIPVQSLS